MKLSDLRPGMVIEYSWVIGRGTVERRSGTIEAITERFMTLHSGRYKDSILIRDFKTGWAKILRVEEGDIEMAGTSAIPVPEKEIVEQAKAESKNAIEMGEKLNVSSFTANKWLKHYGLPTTFSDRKKPEWKEPPEPNPQIPNINPHPAEVPQIIPVVTSLTPMAKAVFEAKPIPFEPEPKDNALTAAINILMRPHIAKVEAVLADETALSLMRMMLKEGQV